MKSSFYKFNVVVAGILISLTGHAKQDHLCRELKDLPYKLSDFQSRMEALSDIKQFPDSDYFCKNLDKDGAFISETVANLKKAAEMKYHWTMGACRMRTSIHPGLPGPYDQNNQMSVPARDGQYSDSQAYLCFKQVPAIEGVDAAGAVSKVANSLSKLQTSMAIACAPKTSTSALQSIIGNALQASLNDNITPSIPAILAGTHCHN